MEEQAQSLIDQTSMCINIVIPNVLFSFVPMFIKRSECLWRKLHVSFNPFLQYQDIIAVYTVTDDQVS